MTNIGIDNGLDGGIVAIGALGHIIGMWVMPTITVIQPARKTTPKKELREVDSVKLNAILNSIDPPDKMHVTFEECPNRAQHSNTMRSMGISAGKILAILETRCISHSRILNYDWQPTMLGKVPQGKTKEYALNKVKQLWPDETFLATKRSSVPHDGMVDAALIAEYGRLKTQTQPTN